MNSSVLKGLSLALTLTFSALTHASVISFAANPNPFIDGNYAGFNWSGGDTQSWVNGSVVPLTPAAPAAPNGYAWSNGGTNLEFSLASPGTFTFNSFDVYADALLWGGAPSQLTIEGWAAGVLLHTFTTGTLDNLPRGSFSTVTLNWSGIDTVKFDEQPNENILLTNLTVDEGVPVPEPTSIALCAAALVGLSFGRRFRRRVST